MLIKIAMTKGKQGRRVTTCRPTDQQSTRILSDFYPDANWLEDRPFDTGEFTLHVSGAPLGDEAAVKLPPLPYIETKSGFTRFEIQDSKGNRIGTSIEHPVTQLVLRTSELDPAIIDEKLPIYLGVSPAAPLVIVDGPEELGINGDDDPDDEDDVITQGVEIIIQGDDTRSDQDIANEFLTYFLRMHVEFHSGSKLTSEQLTNAIRDFVPEYVRTDLITQPVVTRAVFTHFNARMGKSSARIDGRHQKFWKFRINLELPPRPRPPGRTIR